MAASSNHIADDDDKNDYGSSSLPASVASPFVPPENPKNSETLEMALIEAPEESVLPVMKHSEPSPNTVAGSKKRATRSSRIKTMKANESSRKEAKLKTESESTPPDTSGNSKKRSTRSNATKSASKEERSKPKKELSSPDTSVDSRKRSTRSKKAPKWQRPTRKKNVKQSTEQQSIQNNAPRGVTLRPSGKWQGRVYFAGASRYIGVYDDSSEAQRVCEACNGYLQPFRESETEFSKEDVTSLVDQARQYASRVVVKPSKK